MSNLSARELLLGSRLDRLSRAYPRAISQSDPIRFPAAYDRSDDREVAGWIASAFAYGRVETILASVGRVLAALGPHPARAVDSISDFPRFAREALAGFRHRFHSAADATALLYAIASVRAEAGSVRKFFEGRQRPEDADAGGMLSRAVVRVLDLDWRPAGGGRSLSATSPVRFFFPDPASGSACKRWNLYLRWMVRRDALDFGLWEGISPARLVVPTDTHVHRVARRLNLTRRKSADWKTAREITDRLARFDPRDPVRYDYALCRLGVLGVCRSALPESRCGECPIADGCPVGRRRLGSACHSEPSPACHSERSEESLPRPAEASVA